MITISDEIVNQSGLDEQRFNNLKINKMGVIQKQFIKDDDGNQVGIILSIAEYQALIDQLEELEDIIAFDKAKTEPSDPMPFKDFLAELEKPT